MLKARKLILDIVEQVVGSYGMCWKQIMVLLKEYITKIMSTVKC